MHRVDVLALRESSQQEYGEEDEDMDILLGQHLVIPTHRYAVSIRNHENIRERHHSQSCCHHYEQRVGLSSYTLPLSLSPPLLQYSQHPEHPHMVNVPLKRSLATPAFTFQTSSISFSSGRPNT